MIIFLLASHALAHCPEWVCKSLNYTVCATLYGTQILANSDGCPTDFYCRLEEFYDWSSLQDPSSFKSFICTRQNYDGIDADTIDKRDSSFCGTRDEDGMLKIGSHPKECLSDDDCLTKGGWTTQCACGLDGNMYCKADINSNAFEGYWSDCETARRSSNDARIDARTKAYWDFYQNYYLEIASAPDCLPNLIWEFQILNDLYDLANSGSIRLILSLIPLICV